MTANLFSLIRKGVIVLSVLIGSSLLLQNCAGTDKHRKGKLSDAMEESSDKHKGERKVGTEPEPDYEPEEEDYFEEDLVEHRELSATDSLLVDSSATEIGPKHDWLTIAAGTGLLKEEDYFGLIHFNLAYGGFLGRKHFVELAAGFNWAPLQETSLLSESLDDGVLLLQISLGYKYYLTPPHTFMGLYLCAGLGYTYMHWTYKNPFQAMTYDEYGDELGMETISADGLSGFEMYTGAGLNIVQTDGFQLGVEVLPGMILWSGETSEGFDNDIFETFYYTKLKFFLRFGW